MVRSQKTRIAFSAFALVGMAAGIAVASEEWHQLKFDARHSGNVPERAVTTPLGLIGAVPLSDAVFTSPVVSEGRVYVVDGSGVLTCVDARSLEVAWRFASRGGTANCNNVSSPAIADRFVHFGTMAGSYYVVDKMAGTVVREMRCKEPIFSAPVVANGRVYFSTLGSRVYSVEPDGSVCWTWDFVADQLGLSGNRWSGQEWQRHRHGKVTREDQFLCARDVAVYGKTVVIPTGGTVVWLEDRGDHAERRAVHASGNPTLGMSLGENGDVYRQWHWLDNRGRVDILRWDGQVVDRDHVAGTETNTQGGLLSFSSVSLRGTDVYRTRPEAGFGLCKHVPGQAEPQTLGGYPSIASPILLADSAVYGGLNGRLYVVPLSGSGNVWSYETAFGKAIGAPVAVCDGRIYFGCEDGYLYILGPGGQAPRPSRDLQLAKIRSPLTSQYADAKYNRFTSFADWSNANSEPQDLRPPLEIKWLRRFEGTTKHFSTCGGGRMYTHTAEGQIFAVEQETGRLLWRTYYPGVHICYTSPLYFDELLLIPQAGLESCQLRCLDAATGKLLWQSPFAGSPSWNRQLPPIVHQNLAIYMFGTGRYGPDAPYENGEQRLSWLFGHQNVPSFPQHHRPMLRAYDLKTGDTVWEKDFSEYGSGGDEAGVCLMDGTLYYSCFFGHSAKRRGQPGPAGLTAAIDPGSGKVEWLTTAYSVRGGCTISAKDGRLYLGGYNAVGGTENRHVWCLNARDGSLVWQSEPLLEAIQVATVGPRFVFVHAQYKLGYLLDKDTGKILTTLTEGYKCTRFTHSEPYLLGSNMDLIDVSNVNDIELISSGPRVDPSECVGAVVSNGRIFYTGHGSGLQVSQVFGDEANSWVAPWEQE